MFPGPGFFAAGAGVVSPLPGGAIFDFNIAGANGLWQFQSDGSVWMDDSTMAITKVHEWYRPATSGIGSSYWIKATVQSGITPGGDSVGTVLSLSSSRSWSLGATNNQTKQCSLLVQIYGDSAGTQLLAQGTYSIGVDSNNM